jgi:putative MATE family efflux protein
VRQERSAANLEGSELRHTKPPETAKTCDTDSGGGAPCPTDPPETADPCDTADGRRALDREIFRLAIPAFGALAAEPVYVLIDTAIVGHLGTRPLGGLGVAAAVLTAAFGVFNFLAYGATATVARRLGAGDRRGAAHHGVASMWLALALGVGLTALLLALSGPIVDVMGASDGVRPYALSYLRISLLGAPAMLVTLAGTGYLRGLQNTRTPLIIALAAATANLALEVIFVYGLDLGIAGSAWGTVIAQMGAVTAYVVLVRRDLRRADASPRPRLAEIRTAAEIGAHLTVRTASLLAAFLSASAIAARLGDVQIAAHQIAWQLWWFLALSLDAIAIAGQAIVGRTLGASDVRRTRLSCARMMRWGLIVGIVLGVLVAALDPLITIVFTSDGAVRHELLGLLLVVALMQPLAAAVFVLDGILIGAGDVRYLALAMVGATLCYLPFALLVLVTDAGLIALWGALTIFMLARFVGMFARYRRDTWLVTGAAAT